MEHNLDDNSGQGEQLQAVPGVLVEGDRDCVAAGHADLAAAIVGGNC